MSWEQRLREMVLACGALAATACAENAGYVYNGPLPNAGDPASADTPSDDAGDTTSVGTAPPWMNTVPCCNANPDPCCFIRYCGDPMTEPCVGEMACTAEGGIWSSVTGCSISADAAPNDAASDAAPSDTGADGHD